MKIIPLSLKYFSYFSRLTAVKCWRYLLRNVGIAASYGVFHQPRIPTDIFIVVFVFVFVCFFFFDNKPGVFAFSPS